jgi:hypothetical protein
MMGPVGFTLLLEKCPELLMDFDFNHKSRTLADCMNFNSDTPTPESCRRPPNAA